MAAVRFPPRTSLPAPVIAAVIAILATRLFNLLMVILHPDGNHSAELLFRLSPLPGYLLIFIGAVLLFLFEIGCALALLRGSLWGRRGFIGCQCLLVVLMLPALWGAGIAVIPGVDIQDIQQLGRHILLQKLPDSLIILMLCHPASSRRFFQKS